MGKEWVKILAIGVPKQSGSAVKCYVSAAEGGAVVLHKLPGFFDVDGTPIGISSV